MQNNSILFFVACCLLLLSSFNVLAQTTTEIYNIRAMGMDVGTITVNQQRDGERLTVEAISQVEVRIIFKIKMKYIQTCTYENGVLQESLLEIYKKGEVDSTTSLTKKGDGYTLHKDDEVSYVNDIINYSGSLLWFHEPKDLMEMYFEISGEKTTVNKLGAHEYQITDPHNGNKNEYTYKNGVLQLAIIKHTMANVYLELLPPSTEISATN